MPELPEVETIKRIIEPQIKGQRILSAEVRNEQIIAHPGVDSFSALICGKTITGMDRRGKFLSFCFENGDRIFLHLRMTGQLLVTPPDYPMEKHTHLVLHLSGGYQIRYIDVRRFGRFWYLKHEESDAITGINKLGMEPTDTALSADYLKTTLGKKRKPIKEMLHDQSIIAGIGNIYSDEILYAAGVYPEQKCCDLSDNDWERLSEKIPEVITWAIQVNAMTPEEYLAGHGKEYRNTPFLKAYGHVGQPCAVCGCVFEKITVGGRSSCYCPNCQRKRA
ncbi:MAG: bifunctional DNA-formamidopyrimidine glycosylase/DNA-(apurinic or apyrimidinic site) lyase [Oscillospiraceae bacterium]|nr:bifunctional DNA-formamidopyrimidine glycosylase/DNA-(apurinic or apyrimidinic site) lyase [Oscillospiraceae bacterium]